MGSSPAGRSGDRRRSRALAAFGAYVVLTVAFTYPLAAHLGSVVPSDPGDPVLNTWILWWNAHAVPFTAAWWNAPAFFPAEGVLSFSEHLFGLSWISTPLIWMSGNPQLGYNTAFFLTFPLSALAAYLLCFELTGRRDASFIGGLVFGFAPYRISHMPQIQVLASYWMPLALLGLHRFLRDGRRRWLALFGAAWLTQALCNGYFLVYFSVLVLVWLAWYLPGRNVRTIGSIAVAWALAAIPVVPLMLEYHAIHDSFGFGSRLGMTDTGADILSVLDASPALAVWGFVHVHHQAEGELFPGIAGILLVTIAIVMAVSRHRTGATRAWLARTRVVLSIATLIFLVLGLCAIFVPWRISHLGLSVSATNPSKQFGFALVAFLGFVGTSPAMLAAYRRRSSFAFYVLAGCVLWLFCLGPLITAGGVPILHGGPYAWLLALPGVDRLRVPARFAMVAIVCLSAAAALAFARVVPRETETTPGGVLRRWRLALATVAAVLAMADGWMRAMPLAAIPDRGPIAGMEAAGAVIEFPYGDGYHDLAAMYRGMSHGHPVVNGYSGYFPAAHEVLIHGLDRTDPQVLHELAALGVRYAVVDTREDGDGKWRRYLGAFPGVESIDTGGAFALFRLPAEPAALPSLPSGPELPISSIQADVNPGKVDAMTDHDLASRWESGPQQAPHELILDLGASARVNALILSLGPYPHDFPRSLVVDLSDDGRAWVTGWRGEGAGPAFAAAVQDPKRVPVVVPLGGAGARFIRLRQVGTDPTFYWSVAELAVIAPAIR